MTTKPTPPKKKTPIIQPKPRAPLTDKREAAIHAYVTLRCKNKMSLPAIVEQTIRTERLDPEELYTRLHKHGYRYLPRLKRWLHTQPTENIRQLARQNGYNA